MTIVEFLHPLSNSTHQNRVLAILYFNERYAKRDGLTVDEIRDGLERARVRRWKKINVADVLAKAGPYVDATGIRDSRKVWSLTETGRRIVRSILGLPEADVEVEHDAGTLEDVIATVTDSDIRDYLDEALKCLRVGALRAVVVFVWSGAIRSIHQAILKKGVKRVNAALRVHDPKARAVNSLDDFAYVKDHVTLLAARDLKIFDKHEKDTLKEALDLRNRSGHPGKYRPGVKKVSSFIEDIVSIVF